MGSSISASRRQKPLKRRGREGAFVMTYLEVIHVKFNNI
jgi:hypothetical protein